MYSPVRIKVPLHVVQRLGELLQLAVQRPALRPLLVKLHTLVHLHTHRDDGLGDLPHIEWWKGMCVHVCERVIRSESLSACRHTRTPANTWTHVQKG